MFCQNWILSNVEKTSSVAISDMSLNKSQGIDVFYQNLIDDEVINKLLEFN